MHLNEFHDLVILGLVDYRAQAALGLVGIADLDLLCTLLQLGIELFGDAALY